MLDVSTTLINFEEWLKRRNLSPNTIYTYMSAVRKFLLGEPDITSIDAYNEYIFEHGVKKRSNYCFDALKLFLTWNIEVLKDDKLQSSILQSVRRNLLKPKAIDSKKNIRFLDAETRKGVIGLFRKHKHRLMAKLQNELGVRIGDILKLKRGNVVYDTYELEGKQGIVMKIDFESKGKRHIVKWVFNPSLQLELEAYIKTNMIDDEYLFMAQREGVPFVLNYRNNYNMYLLDLKEALKSYGVECEDWATHDFRRCFARTVWDLKKDPELLQRMLDHKHLDTTMLYLKKTGMQTKDVYHELNQKAS